MLASASGKGGVSGPRGGVGLWPWGGSLVPGGGSLVQWGGTGIRACTEADPPPVDRITDACKNITLAQLRCGQ